MFNYFLGVIEGLKNRKGTTGIVVDNVKAFDSNYHINSLEKICDAGLGGMASDRFNIYRRIDLSVLLN